MSIFDKLGRGRTQSLANRLITESRLAAEMNSKSFEDMIARKSYAYLKNDISGIRHYLLSHLLTIYNQETLSQMPLVVVNDVPRIIRKLTLVYKLAPTVTITSDQYIQATKRLNRERKEFHRQAKMFNTVLVRPIWDQYSKGLRHMILNRGICDVVPSNDNPLRADEVSYDIVYPDAEGKNRQYKIVWTNDEHYAVDLDKDKRASLPFMPSDGKNPYGRIPFVTLRLEEANDFWGDGLPDLVNANEALNGRLSDLFYKLYFSFGVPVGTNLGITADEFVIGPNRGIMVNKVREGDVRPGLEFSTPDHKGELDKLVDEWFRTELARSKGLPSNGIQYKSGYDRLVDNYEVLDQNEDDTAALREFETELYDMQKQIAFQDARVDFGKESFGIQFQPVELPAPQNELWAGRDKEFEYNISTPIDWLKEKNPHATDEELMATLKANKELKDELTKKRAQRTLDIILNTPQPDDDGEDND